MPERHEWLAGVPCWVDTSEPDPEAATEFYGGLFGWAFEDRMPEGSDGQYFVASLGGRIVAAVGSQMGDGGTPPAWMMYVAVDDADATAAKVRDAGGAVLAEPFDVGEAGRMAVFADPAGAVFSVWQARETKGVEAVNEHGSWNFSGLNTPDRSGAEAFYGAVFGWELGDFGDGSGSGYWRMPGYGDFLERKDPDIRKRNAELGAPDRFEDAVATLQPPAGDDTPAHWSTTFAVDDADGVADRAKELGGSVVVPPTDAPWVRFAVIQDPQGATFIASKFVPPS
jgi:predicted enzyme related to lactoylglutathione lyase